MEKKWAHVDNKQAVSVHMERMGTPTGNYLARVRIKAKLYGLILHM